MKTKVTVYCVFKVHCPHCEMANRWEPVMNSQGDTVYSHLLDVIKQVEPREFPMVTCDECKHEFQPYSFSFPGSIK